MKRKDHYRSYSKETSNFDKLPQSLLYPIKPIVKIISNQ